MPRVDRQRSSVKLELLELAFGTTSETAIGELLPEAIRDGYRVIVREAEGRSLVHIVENNGKRAIRIGAAPEGQMTLTPEPTNDEEPFPTDHIAYPKEPVGSGTARAAKAKKPKV